VVRYRWQAVQGPRNLIRCRQRNGLILVRLSTSWHKYVADVVLWIFFLFGVLKDITLGGYCLAVFLMRVFPAAKPATSSSSLITATIQESTSMMEGILLSSSDNAVLAAGDSSSSSDTLIAVRGRFLEVSATAWGIRGVRGVNS
jgi:hypothetical protein